MPHEQTKDENSVGGNLRIIVLIAVLFILLLFAVHCTWVTSNAYSSPSVVLATYDQSGRQILDDFREAYFWLWQNTDENARIMSWWDYGYQIAGMGNRTTLVDNNTWNNSHIALVRKTILVNISKKRNVKNYRVRTSSKFFFVFARLEKLCQVRNPRRMIS